MGSHHTLLLFHYASHDLDKLTCTYFGIVALLCLSMAILSPKDNVVVLANFPMTLIPYVRS
jgi:hypothetical protein